MNPLQTTLIDPQSGKPLAQISLDGDPIRANELICDNGQLQGFTILSNPKRIKKAWFNQETLLLRIGKVEKRIKIITYPSDGENQGHFAIVDKTREHNYQNKDLQKQAQRGVVRHLTLFSSLFNA